MLSCYYYYYLEYKVQNENELLSVNLRDPLSMEFPIEMCNLFLRNQILLKKYGISLGSLKENILLIRTVPQCLVTNNDLYNREKILPKISGLLNDVIKNCNTSQINALPLTIHNAIASEACHGTHHKFNIYDFIYIYIYMCVCIYIYSSYYYIKDLLRQR